MSTSAIEALADLDQPYAPLGPADDALFERALVECDEWHRARNPTYAHLWTDGRRPLVPVSLLKRADLATPVGDEGAWLSTSGTGSQGKTRVLFDRATLRRIERGMTQIFLHHRFVDLEPANFLLLSPDPSQGDQAGYATTFLKFTGCAPVRDRVFAVDSSGRFLPEVAGRTLRGWAGSTSPVFLFGLTVYFEQLCLSCDTPIGLTAPVRALTGGGWKGSVQRLSRPEILGRLRSLLSGCALDVRDLFGMTEHPLHYMSCREGRFHVPKYSRFDIVDAGGRALPEGETGLIRLLNPFLATLPSHDLLTEDMGSWGTGCPCGELLPYLCFLGRVTAPVGTCAQDAAAKLRS